MHLFTQILKFITIFVIVMVSFAIPTKADIIINTQVRSAILYTKISTFDDKYLTIDLILNPNNQAINMVGAYLKYSSTTLALIDSDMSNSLCSFTAKNSHNEKTGEFLLICGLPSPGTSTEAIITSLKFERIAAGTIKVFPQGESMALANNSLGTNILAKTIGTQIIFP